MRTFETFQEHIGPAATKILADKLQEAPLPYNMALVLAGTPAVEKHEKDGFTQLSVHEFEGNRFYVFTG